MARERIQDWTGKIIGFKEQIGTKRWLYDFYGNKVEENAEIYHWKYDLPEEEVLIPNEFIIKKQDVEEDWAEFFGQIHGIHVLEKKIEHDMEVTDYQTREMNVLAQGTEVYCLPAKQEQIYVMMALFTEKNLCIKMKEDSSVYFI